MIAGSSTVTPTTTAPPTDNVMHGAPGPPLAEAKDIQAPHRSIFPTKSIPPGASKLSMVYLSLATLSWDRMCVIAAWMSCSHGRIDGGANPGAKSLSGLDMQKVVSFLETFLLQGTRWWHRTWTSVRSCVK